MTATPEPTPKKSLFKAFKEALVSWAESPTGKHTLIAIAAAVGAAAEQAIKAGIHG